MYAACMLDVSVLILVAAYGTQSKHAQAGEQYCESGNDGGCISQEFAEKLRWMLRYVRMSEDFGVGRVLSSHSREVEQDVMDSWSEIVRRAALEPESLLPSVLSAHSEQPGFTLETENEYRSITVSPEYQRCKREFDGIVLPLTNSLMRLSLLSANETVCRDVCADRNCPDQCAGTCDELCSGDADELEKLFPSANFSSRAGRVLDATAKIPSAVSEGNIYWVGAYYMCNAIDATPEEEESGTGEYLHGQYCRFPLVPQPKNGTSSPLIIFHGACVPESCDEDSLYQYVLNINGTGNAFLQVFLEELLGVTIERSRIFCGFEMESISAEPGLPACLSILFIILVLMIASTLYDMNIRRHVINKIYKTATEPGQPVINFYSQKSVASSQGGENEIPPPYSRTFSSDSRTDLVIADRTTTSYSMEEQESTSEADGQVTALHRLEVLFLSFSAYSNLRRMWAIQYKPASIPTLDCVRVLSYGYAILGSTWVYGPVYSDFWITANIVRPLTTLPRNFLFQAIIAYHFSSDSFFLISGILVTYQWLSRYSDRSETWKSYLFFYFKRYWRLIPTLMLSILFVNSTYKPFTAGPLSADQIPDVDNCAANWWTDLLLVHNLVNTDQMCFSTTYYFAVLWQLLIASIVVLLPLTRWRKASYIIIGGLFIIHIGVTASITAGIADGEGDWATDYFYTPWCRAGPYLIGLALGIFLYDSKCKLKLNTVVLFLGWIVAMTCILSVTYGTYGVLKEGGEMWDKPTRVMYETFARISWSVGVSWIILVCATGNAGFLNSVFNWPAFLPLSKLVFPTWTMAASVVYGNLYSQEYVIYVNRGSMMSAFFVNIWTTYIVGCLFIGLFFYYPLSLGVIRAMKVNSIEECIKAGDHKTPTVVQASTGSTGKPDYEKSSDLYCTIQDTHVQ